MPCKSSASGHYLQYKLVKGFESRNADKLETTDISHCDIIDCFSGSVCYLQTVFLSHWLTEQPS
jgi:hypothetical protein